MNIVEQQNEIKISEACGFTNISGASKVTGLSKSKLYKLTANRELTHYKPCGKLMFKITELIEWIEKSRN